MTLRLSDLNDRARDLTGPLTTAVRRRIPADVQRPWDRLAGRPPDREAPLPSTRPSADVPPTGLAPGTAVIGYVTVPADQDPGAADAAQRTIERAADRSGWRLLEVVCDRESAPTLRGPNLSAALRRLAEGDAAGLVVADARVLSRSLGLASLIRGCREAEGALVALDLGLDTSTPEGSHVADVLLTVSGWRAGGENHGDRRNGAR